MTGASTAPWIFVHDENQGDLATSVRQLRDHGIGSDQLTTFPSRLDLLAGVAEAGRRVVVLVDLQADDRHDQNYSGHRIIETIRRHQNLAPYGRPLAYTVHARPDVIALAQRHGALGLISKTDLDVPDDQISTVGFVQHLEAARDRAASESASAFSVFPDTERAAARYARTEETVRRGLEHVLSREATSAEPARPFFWDLIGYLAEGLEPVSAAHWIAADSPAVTPEQVTKSLERLKPAVAAEFRAGSNVDWASFARELLEVVPHHRSAPTVKRALRTLVRVHEIEDLLTERDLRRRGFLDAEAADALDLVLTGDDVSVPQRTGHEGRWKHTNDLLATIAAIEPTPAGQARLTAAFVRGVNNIYATYLEDRATERLSVAE